MERPFENSGGGVSGRVQRFREGLSDTKELMEKLKEPVLGPEELARVSRLREHQQRIAGYAKSMGVDLDRIPGLSFNSTDFESTAMLAEGLNKNRQIATREQDSLDGHPHDGSEIVQVGSPESKPHVINSMDESSSQLRQASVLLRPTSSQPPIQNLSAQAGGRTGEHRQKIVSSEKDFGSRDPFRASLDTTADQTLIAGNGLREKASHTPVNTRDIAPTSADEDFESVLRRIKSKLNMGDGQSHRAEGVINNWSLVKSHREPPRVRRLVVDSEVPWLHSGSDLNEGEAFPKLSRKPKLEIRTVVLSSVTNAGESMKSEEGKRSEERAKTCASSVNFSRDCQELGTAAEKIQRRETVDAATEAPDISGFSAREHIDASCQVRTDSSKHKMSLSDRIAAFCSRGEVGSSLFAYNAPFEVRGNEMIGAEDANYFQYPTSKSSEVFRKQAEVYVDTALSRFHSLIESRSLRRG